MAINNVRTQNVSESSSDDDVVSNFQIDGPVAMDGNIEIINYSVSNPSKPRHPHYQLKETRLRSFEMWPKYLLPRPEELSEAGFFYLERGDCLICFHCGIGVRDWEPTDSAIGEHLKWVKILNIQCDFANRVKGALTSSKKEPATARECRCTNITSSSSEDANMQNVKVEKNSIQCTVCLENELQVAYQPCGHVASCISCAVNLKKCPLCRDDVVTFIRVFLP